jgi:hypothetical protein
MKSKTCNECNSRGKKEFGLDDLRPCYQCNTRGIVTEARFRYLTEVY